MNHLCLKACFKTEESVLQNWNMLWLHVCDHRYTWGQKCVLWLLPCITACTCSPALRSFFQEHVCVKHSALALKCQRCRWETQYIQLLQEYLLFPRLLYLQIKSRRSLKCLELDLKWSCVWAKEACQQTQNADLTDLSKAHVVAILHKHNVIVCTDFKSIGARPQCYLDGTTI